MNIKKLELEKFRNYRKQNIKFNKGINIIYGDNAQGKTNILEAIYLFSLGKSNRTVKDSELIMFDEEEARVKIEFKDERRINNEEIIISKRNRKKIFLNEIPVRKNSEIVGKFNVVYFGPEYLDLIKGGPKKRRKNIDILISQLKVSYFSAIGEYKKIIDQKNALLKKNPDELMLLVLNEKILKNSVLICKLRYEYIKKLEEKAKILQKDISDGKEKIEIKYISPIGYIEEFDEKVFYKKLKKKLEENIEKEIYFKESQIGPHRDDIEYKINGFDVKSYGSQGQQKTCVLVQKIAEVELLKEETGEYPVLLLDDIMSELDKKRQEFIVKKIKNMQIIITCTDKESLDKYKKVKCFEIKNGKVL